MKKFVQFLSSIAIILIISISCSEKSDQPISPADNSGSISLSKDNGITPHAKFGVIGKLFNRDEANTLFGKVTTSASISTADLKSALSRGTNYILFTIKNGQVVIRDEKKQYLSFDRYSIGKDEQMYMFSKSAILQLLSTRNATISLSKSADDNVAVELRAGVLTLTYGVETLEFAMPCPPICPD